MATLWTFPLQPQASAAGSPVTAAALTAGTPSPPPVIPAGIYQNGCRLRIKATCEITSTSATPTCISGFYIGAVGGAIGSALVLAASAALAISASAAAWPFILDYDGTIRTLSPSAGVINGQGKVTWWGNVGLSGAASVNPMPITAAARTISNLNTMQNNQLDVGITLSSTTGTPSVTITNLWAELSG